MENQDINLIISKYLASPHNSLDQINFCTEQSEIPKVEEYEKIDQCLQTFSSDNSKDKERNLDEKHQKLRKNESELIDENTLTWRRQNKEYVEELLKELIAENKTLKKLRDTWESEFQRQQNQLKTVEIKMQKSINSLKSDKMSLLIRIENLEKEICSKNNEIERLKLTVNDAESYKNAIKEELDAEKRNAISLCEEIKDLKKSISDQKDWYDARAHQLEIGFSNKISQLLSQLGELENINRALKENAKVKDESIDCLNSEISSLHSAIKAIQENQIDYAKNEYARHHTEKKSSSHKHKHSKTSHHNSYSAPHPNSTSGSKPKGNLPIASPKHQQSQEKKFLSASITKLENELNNLGLKHKKLFELSNDSASSLIEMRRDLDTLASTMNKEKKELHSLKLLFKDDNFKKSLK
ncbi:unnamed protein product [Blepharisma stoltei]|uniref:Uncharacterized protein n=1 Tax=Blepharisma stoltei TaxID=1481888 RepID=A0AAU9KCY5_9CILI|nr:unnamed protein product [Blepharisma stoltei]